MIKKCQVCDGPVVNGRCKYCGMPYRNDEVLYHLNESRADHYRHATPDAKKIMRQQSASAQNRKEALGRTSSKEEIKLHQQKVRQAAVERMTTVKTPTAGKRETSLPSGSPAKAARKQGGSYGKNSRRNSKYSLFVAVILLLAAVIPGIVEEAETRYGASGEKIVGFANETWTVPETEEAELLEWVEENGEIKYYLKPANGEVTVGEDLEPGTYEAFVESGSASVIISGFSDRNYNIRHGQGSIVLVLRDEDTIFVSDDSSANHVVLKKWGSNT